MNPAVFYRKALRVIVAILVFAFIPSLVSAQKKGSGGGGSSKPSAPAPKAAPKAAAPAAKPGAQARPGTPGAKPGTPGARPGTPGARPGTPGAKPGTPGAKPGAPGTKPAATTGRPAGAPAAKPAAGTVHNPDGSSTKTNANGSSTTIGKSGKPTSMTTANGTKASLNSRGKPTSVSKSVTDPKNPNHSGTMTINHGSRGAKSVITNRKDGSRLVSTGAHRGYVEHSFNRGGRPYMRRTYVVNGRSYAAVYRGYPYRGGVYYGYVPGYYYAPGFYGWAYDPWAEPVPYAWGWGGAPWFGFYGGFFTPFAAYADASLWLTDYALAESLQAAYQAQLDANGGNPPPPDDQGGGDAGAAPQTATGITPEVKAAIDEEVKAQLAAEKAAAAPNAPAAPADQPPPALDPNLRTFIVATALSEPLPDGTSCSLSTGDVLTRLSTDPDANQNVNVLVTSSQSGDCSSGVQVAVGVQDLQDMHNEFAQKIDAGLQKLADNQGKGGLPSGPAPGQTKNADGQAAPDLTATADLQQQQQDANAAENDVKQAGGSQGDD